MTSTALIETAMELGANRDPGTHRLILKWPHPHWRSSQRRRTLTVALSGRSSPAGSSIHTAFSDSHAAQVLWALPSLQLAAVDAPNLAWLNRFRLVHGLLATSAGAPYPSSDRQAPRLSTVRRRRHPSLS